MSEERQNGHREADAGRGAPARRRTPWPLVVVAALFIVVPALYWYGTWFGRSLTDEQVEKYLNEADNPRHMQHALSQIGERIESGRPGTERWYPRVVEVTKSVSPDVRMTAAWVMGLEHTREEFRAALLALVEDEQPIVRRNAALALVRFGDARARPELLAMLRPYEVQTRTEGVALTCLTEGAQVKRDTLLVRYTLKSHGDSELRSPLPGTIAQARVKEGDSFRAGDHLFVLAPDEEHVRDALVGLYYVGTPEDLAEVERYAAGAEGMPEEVKRQAAATAEAIRRRAGAHGS